MPRSSHSAARAAVLLGLLLAPGLAAQSPVTVSGELAFRSRYLFAGIPFAAAEVTQAKVTVGAGALTMYAFSVLDHAAGEVTEADVYGDYYVQLAPSVGAFVGAALYHFKIGGSWEGTPELYGGVVLTAPLSPTLYFAHDFDLGDGSHATLTLSRALPLGASGATLGLAGKLGYNDGYYVDDSGFSAADVGVSVNVPLGPVLVTPMVQIQRAIGDLFTDEELFGVTAAITF